MNICIITQARRFQWRCQADFRRAWALDSARKCSCSTDSHTPWTAAAVARLPSNMQQKNSMSHIGIGKKYGVLPGIYNSGSIVYSLCFYGRRIARRRRGLRSNTPSHRGPILRERPTPVYFKYTVNYVIMSISDTFIHHEYLFTSYTVNLTMFHGVYTRQRYMYKQSRLLKVVTLFLVDTCSFNLGFVTFKQLVMVLHDAHFVQKVQVGELRWRAIWIFAIGKHVRRNIVIYKT